MKDNKKAERPIAYPKPTETDAQQKNQNEYTEHQSGHRSEDMPAHSGKQQNRETGKKRPERRDIL
jgi:hypothetical protein